jgi:hypothetical protein
VVAELGFDQFLKYLRDLGSKHTMSMLINRNINETNQILTVDVIEARWMLDKLVRCSLMDEMNLAELVAKRVKKSCEVNFIEL